MRYGSYYVDIDGLRLMNPDLTLLAPGGEASFVPVSEYANLPPEEAEDVQFPVRAGMVNWVRNTLADAKKVRRLPPSPSLSLLVVSPARSFPLPPCSPADPRLPRACRRAWL